MLQKFGQSLEAIYNRRMKIMSDYQRHVKNLQDEQRAAQRSEPPPAKTEKEKLFEDLTERARESGVVGLERLQIFDLAALLGDGVPVLLSSKDGTEEARLCAYPLQNGFYIRPRLDRDAKLYSEAQKRLGWPDIKDLPVGVTITIDKGPTNSIFDRLLAAYGGSPKASDSDEVNRCRAQMAELSVSLRKLEASAGQKLRLQLNRAQRVPSVEFASIPRAPWRP